jgi:hypothetical protein
VNSTLKIDLDVVSLFRRPTVAEFAAELPSDSSGGPQSGPPPITPYER